tara:strand:+ start:533 stop:736 length:204 start_codon:yes stop_codon:yes gene_type:complete
MSKKDVDFPNITFGKDGFDQVGNIAILHYQVLVKVNSIANKVNTIWNDVNVNSWWNLNHLQEKRKQF